MGRLFLLLALTACTTGTEDTTLPADYATVVAEALWADDMTVSVAGDTLTVSDDGVPDHDLLEAYALMDGSTTAVGESAYILTFPTVPTVATSTVDTGMGTIGVAISGGQYFNPYEGDGVTVALDNNFDVDGVPFVDTCNGHPLPTGEDYHYHGVPYCITDEVDTDGAHSVLIGVLNDGYPVYGPWGEGGVAPSDLDECSGHLGATPEFVDGVYHYHLTETAPYSIPCYHGVAG
jgi:hypothetical protein